MKKSLLSIIFALSAFLSYTQSKVYIRADTVIVEKNPTGNVNFMIRDISRDSVGGLFTNIGRGVGRYIKPRLVGDTLFLGGDTLVFSGLGGSTYDNVLDANRNSDNYPNYQGGADVSTGLTTWMATPADNGTTYPSHGVAGLFTGGFQGFTGVNPISGRPNYVLTIAGYNHTYGGAQRVAGEHAFGFRAEPFFEQGGDVLAEFHLPAFITRGGTHVRLASWYTNVVTGATAFNFNGVTSSTWTNLSSQDLKGFNSTGNFFWRGQGSGAVFEFQRNNSSSQKLQLQVDAATNYLNSFGNLLQVDGPVNNVMTYGGAYPFQAVVNANGGGRAYYAAGSGLATSLPFEATVSATGDVTFSLENSHPSSTSSRAVILARNLSNGTSATTEISLANEASQALQIFFASSTHSGWGASAAGIINNYGSLRVYANASNPVYMSGSEVYMNNTPVNFNGAYKMGTAGGSPGQALVMPPSGIDMIWADVNALANGDKGDIVWSGTPAGSVQTVDNDAVTFAKMQNITSQRLLGRYALTDGDPQMIEIGSGLSLNSSTGVLSATATGQRFGVSGEDASASQTRTFATGAFTVNITTSTTGQNPLNVQSTTGTAITASATSGGIISGLTTSGTAAYLQSGSGIGVWGVSLANNYGGQFNSGGTLASDVVGIVGMSRSTSATAANGIGGGINIAVQTSTGVVPSTASINAIWSNATHASRTSKLDVNLVNNASDLLAFTITPTGIQLYNTGGAPGASVANGVIIFAEDVASSAEARVRDEAGNVTTISPHNFTGIPGGPSERLAWAHYSEFGDEWINVDMLKLAREVEKLSGVKLVYKGKKKK